MKKQTISSDRESLLLVPLSFFLVFSFFSFGSFRFWNIFGLKLEVDIFLLLCMLPLTFYFGLKQFRKVKIDILIWMMVYLVISSVLEKNFILLHTFQMLISALIVLNILTMPIKYIDLIMKSIIFMVFIFSIEGIILFIYYHYNPSEILLLSRTVEDSKMYLDLSDSTLSEKFGFIIETKEYNLFNIYYNRSRSYFPEPSVSIYMFYSSAIISLFYSKKFKFFGFIIAIFGVVLIYPGVAILSLFFSLFVYIMLYRVKTTVKKKSKYLIILIILIHIFVYSINLETLSALAPISKASSAIARLLYMEYGISDSISHFVYHPNINLPGSIGFVVLVAGVFPFIGFSLVFFFLYKFFIIVFLNTNALLSSLIIGMLVQISVFSSLGWANLPGFLMLSLIYRKFNKRLNI